MGMWAQNPLWATQRPKAIQTTALLQQGHSHVRQYYAYNHVWPREGWQQTFRKEGW